MFTLRFKEAALAGLRYVRLALLPVSLLVALSSCNFTFLETTPSSSSGSITPTVVAVPQISPANGTYTSAQTVSITDATAGATIYYTTDGTSPATSATRVLYTGSFAVSANGTTTINAVAEKSAMTTSAVDTVSYTISASAVGVPAFSVATGFYYADQSVKITDPTSGATIYYTTDGTSPATSSTRVLYTGPVTVSGAGTTETITAYATESGLTASGTTSETYTMSLFSAAQQLFQTSTVPHIAAGDLNGDGETDLVGVESNGYLQIYLQSGGALQAPVTDSQTPAGASTAPTSIAVGDLNGDGLNDIAVGYGNSGLIAVYYQSSSNTFGAPTEISTPDSDLVRIGDVTGDGYADLVGLAWPASTSAMTNDLAVFAQSGGAPATTPAEYTVQEGGYPQMAIADVSGDGLNDVVVMSGQTYGVPQLSVLTQSSSGTLNTPQTYTLPVSNTNANGMGVGDVNGDGLNDVVLSFGDTSPAPQLAVYLQNSSGTLTLQTSTIAVQERPTSLAVLDVNGDGLNDIVADNGYNYGLDVYLQQSNGSYTYEAYAGVLNFGNLVTGDFNGDGQTDLAGSITSGTDQGIVLFTHR